MRRVSPHRLHLRRPRNRSEGFEGHRQGKVSADSHGTRLAQAGGLGSPRALCRDDRRRGVDQQQRSGGLPNHASAALAAPCLRPSKAATALIEKADLIISLDWLDLAGVFRLSLGTAQTQVPADKTIIHCSVDSIRTNGWSMDHQALAAVDIPIFAEPDQFVAQMLDEMDAKKIPKSNPDRR